MFNIRGYFTRNIQGKQAINMSCCGYNNQFMHQIINFLLIHQHKQILIGLKCVEKYNFNIKFII